MEKDDDGTWQNYSKSKFLKKMFEGNSDADSISVKTVSNHIKGWFDWGGLPSFI